MLQNYFKLTIPRYVTRLLKLHSQMADEKCDIALIGLAVMGQNFILNMNDHGFKVCAFNRTVSKVWHFLDNEAKGTNIVGAGSMEDMMSKLKIPRRVMLLVKAGPAVDAFIEKLVPLMAKGDIIIDGGNSEYHDTTRRTKSLREQGCLAKSADPMSPKEVAWFLTFNLRSGLVVFEPARLMLPIPNIPQGIYFVGSGISGGEDGARLGPSLMPGGAPEAWPHIKSIFQASCAKVNGEPCCDWVGDEGAGHFVKGAIPLWSDTKIVKSP